MVGHASDDGKEGLDCMLEKMESARSTVRTWEPSGQSSASPSTGRA